MAHYADESAAISTHVCTVGWSSSVGDWVYDLVAGFWALFCCGLKRVRQFLPALLNVATNRFTEECCTSLDTGELYNDTRLVYL